MNDDIEAASTSSDESTPAAVQDRVEISQAERLRTRLDELYADALKLVDDNTVAGLVAGRGELGASASALAALDHACRGALLTLALYKGCVPAQDIRYNKSEFQNGFSARSIDSRVTVPMLMRESLPRSVETHWLTQTLSFAGAPWLRGTMFKTVPKAAGPLLVEVVNLLEELPDAEQQGAAEDVARIILVRLIEERNRGRVVLTRPKGMPIVDVKALLGDLLKTKYKTGSPRLPQVIIYALYVSLFENRQARYDDCELQPIGRMKAADRKAGTVGDIVVNKSGVPMEAVETKFDMPITLSIVGEAMEKVKTLTVERYLILSTVGVEAGDATEINQRIKGFKASNGCEIIVNGVLETVSYYLRLLPDTNGYVNALATLIEVDPDLGYEHRVAWNKICAER